MSESKEEYEERVRIRDFRERIELAKKLGDWATAQKLEKILENSLTSNGNPPAKIVPIAAAKIELMRAAAEKQLSPEDYQEFLGLITELQIYGLTPLINTQLGRLMAKIHWELEIEKSPEWAEALQACDKAFLGSELKLLCYNYNVSPHGHKKELCRNLYNAKVPEVVRVMEPYFEKINEKASISPHS